MIQRSRFPAVVTLLFVLAAGSLFLGFVRRHTGPGDAQLAQLQAAVAQPDAKPAVWLEFAEKLRELGQLPRAVVAYQRVLETDPYHRQARLQCATALATIGNSDDFHTFMEATLLVDPKLTLNVLGRPEAARYLSEARFQTLQKGAVAGSMD